MNKITRSSISFVAIVTVSATVIARYTLAAENKEGRVTEIHHDVRILASQAASRPAAVNDNVRAGTAVRTGDESRAEITFNDQSLARLGANTVFSFSGGAKTYDLGSGAILMTAPEGAGELKIRTSAATAAVSGFTAMFEHHPKGWSKLIILHGNAKVSFPNLNNEPCRLGDAQMIMWPPKPQTCPTVYDVDISKLLHGKLVKGFKNQLPEHDILLNIVRNNEANPPSGGLKDPTGIEIVDKRAAAEDHSPPPSPPMHSPPPKRPQ